MPDRPIRKEMKNRRKNDDISGFSSVPEKNYSIWQMNWEKNIVNDPDAPELYSEQAVFGFSLFTAPIFGSVLMAMNFRRLGKSELIIPVILFGILWYALVMILSPEKPQSFTVFLFNMPGAVILTRFLWTKFIGRDFKYRTRRILIPVIIGIIICGLSLSAMFVSN